MRQVGWKIVSCVIPSDFCRMKSDGVEWSWIEFRGPYLKNLTTVRRRKPVMPSAHGPIFCRKELREKVGVKVRFFLGLIQRKRPTFCRKQLREKNRTDFFLDQKSAHRDRLFIGAIVSDNSRRGLIVGWRHSDFLSDWSQRTRTDFLS